MDSRNITFVESLINEPFCEDKGDSKFAVRNTELLLPAIDNKELKFLFKL